MKNLWRKISIWWIGRKYRRSMKKYPKAYIQQGNEFDNWEAK